MTSEKEETVMEEKLENDGEQIEISSEEIERILRWHIYGSFSIGLIPLPIFDMAALTVIQLNLIRKLAEAYEVPFFKEKVKNLLTSLISAIIPNAISPSIASIVKAIPIVGSSIGVVTMPIIAGATTYATGKVFIRHFESGGTFLTFDADKTKEYYKEMFEKGKDIVGKLREDDNKNIKKTDKPETSETTE